MAGLRTGGLGPVRMRFRISWRSGIGLGQAERPRTKPCTGFRTLDQLRNGSMASDGITDTGTVSSAVVIRGGVQQCLRCLTSNGLY
jgi:hypothetical protein